VRPAAEKKSPLPSNGIDQRRVGGERVLGRSRGLAVTKHLPPGIAGSTSEGDYCSLPARGIEEIRPVHACLKMAIPTTYPMPVWRATSSKSLPYPIIDDV
jgi:hypothetical protein